MRKLLLSAVLTLASFAPASAQQTATVSARQTATVDSNQAYTSLDSGRRMNCDNPISAIGSTDIPATTTAAEKP
jgi:hypothetical protein